MYGSSFFIMCGIDWIMSSDDDHNFIDVWSWWVKRECIFLLSHIIINCTQHDVCLIYSITHRRREYQFNICRGIRKCWNCSTTPKTERTKRNDWILRIRFTTDTVNRLFMPSFIEHLLKISWSNCSFRNWLSLPRRHYSRFRTICFYATDTHAEYYVVEQWKTESFWSDGL